MAFMLALFTQYFFMSNTNNFCYNYNELIANDKKNLIKLLLMWWDRQNATCQQIHVYCG
jgi:hypothetical protein